MDFFRVGEKLISLQKIVRLVKKVLKLRTRGFSQQEVAQRLDLDRSFISRLETLGEVRKGKKLAVVGFPIKNKEEIERISDEAGIDFILLMSNEERWNLVKNRSGMDFFDRVMQILTMLREFDAIIVIGSDKWLQIAEALFDKELFFVELAPSPIEQDCYFDPERYKGLLSELLHTRNSK